jgi:hypothetical protein
MTPTRVLPFLLHTQGENVHVGIRTGITVTEIALQGLMRLEGDALIFQFATARQFVRVGGGGVRTRRESDPVREVAVPLSAMVSIELRRPRWRFWAPWELVVFPGDLRAFDGLPLADSPRSGELAMRVEWRDRVAAAELVDEVELAMAERVLEEATSAAALRSAQPALLTGTDR